MNDIKISLIAPPFSTYLRLHLGIPVLTAYLRSKGINVSVWDANIDFLNFMLSPDKVKTGKNFLENRFLELNEKKLLIPDEKSEYDWYGTVLNEAESIPDERRKYLYDINRYKSPDYNPYVSNDIETALHYSTAQSYPERFLHSDINYFYNGIYSPYSTTDIISSVKENNVFSDFFEKYIHDFLEREKPDIIGFSVTFGGQVTAVFTCANIIKKIAPDIHITIGGSWISATMPKLENTKIFDIVDSMIIDDGEIPLELLAKELSKDKPDFNNVPGTIYLKNGQITKVPPEKPLDIESLPPPDYSDFPLEKYPIVKKLISVNLRSSRGCNWRKCIFCPHQLNVTCNHQLSSAEYVFNCLEHVSDQTGCSQFSFVEEASNINTLEHLAQLINISKKHLYWTTSIRLDRSITLDRCMQFKKSGCRMLYFGIETYNDRLLKYIGKGLDKKTINYALSNIAWSGINSMAYMMVGLPTETEKEAVDSYKEIIKLKDKGLLKNYLYSSLNILPGSEIYNNPEKYGIKILFNSCKADLPYPGYNFEGTPISMSRAYELSKKFTQSIFISPYLNSKNTVNIGGKDIQFKHGVEI